MTPDGRHNRDLRATLPINQLKGKPPVAVCPILNVHRCKKSQNDPFIKNRNRLSKTNTQEEGNNNDHYSGNGSGGASGGVCGDDGSISKISKKISKKTMKRKTKTKKNWTNWKKRKIQKTTKKNWTRRMNAIYVTLYSIPSKNYSAKK